MPLYDYRCDQCGHTFERLAKMSDPNPPCPQIIMVTEDSRKDGTSDRNEWVCGGSTTKLITGGTFHLVGSGWAKDGYSG